jgi:hypothetical protein
MVTIPVGNALLPIGKGSVPPGIIIDISVHRRPFMLQWTK